MLPLLTESQEFRTIIRYKTTSETAGRLSGRHYVLTRFPVFSKQRCKCPSVTYKKEKDLFLRLNSLSA